MNPYEIMLLLDAELAEERQNEILTRIRELVEKRGGSWQSDDAWGRRKLAFEIDKKTEAFYYLLVFDCDAETLGPVLSWIVENLGQDLSVDQLARQHHMSSRTFARRFRAVVV